HLRQHVRGAVGLQQAARRLPGCRPGRERCAGQARDDNPNRAHRLPERDHRTGRRRWSEGRSGRDSARRCGRARRWRVGRCSRGLEGRRRGRWYRREGCGRWPARRRPGCRRGGERAADFAVNCSAGHRSTVNRSTVNRSTINRSAVNHSAVNHSAVNHSAGHRGTANASADHRAGWLRPAQPTRRGQSDARSERRVRADRSRVRRRVTAAVLDPTAAASARRWLRRPGWLRRCGR
ncbi:MAG: hypothetical protein QOC83_2976, partial [Pseudonocardiales bacterium]|nr:hypothetical protein [Pseudonocardiales bacterium]